MSIKYFLINMCIQIIYNHGVKAYFSDMLYIWSLGVFLIKLCKKSVNCLLVFKIDRLSD